MPNGEDCPPAIETNDEAMDENDEVFTTGDETSCKGNESGGDTKTFGLLLAPLKSLKRRSS